MYRICVPLLLLLATATISSAQDASAQETPATDPQSVKPGINDRFLDSELNVKEWIDRFEVPTNLGRFPIAFQIADSMNLTYNDCPSLHVAYGVMGAEVFRRKQPRRGWLFHLWALAIAISAWLTYQHHLADIVAGYALALTAVYLITRYARVDPAQSAA
jgi:hypothetical protein